MVKLFLFFVVLFVSVAFVIPETKALHHGTYTDSLSKDTIAIDEVIVNQPALSPLEIFEKKKAAYKSIYFWGDTKDMVTLPPMGGIAININKLYNKFSRLGRNSRRLQRNFEREYQDDVANDIWNPLVAEYVTLEGDSLTRFVMYYKPSSTFLMNATHYERVAYLVRSLKNYRDSAEIIHQWLTIKEQE